MKIMVKPASAVNLDAYKMADSFVLPILGFAVDYNNYFTLEEMGSTPPEPSLLYGYPVLATE